MCSLTHTPHIHRAYYTIAVMFVEGKKRMRGDDDDDYVASHTYMYIYSKFGKIRPAKFV